MGALAEPAECLQFRRPYSRKMFASEPDYHWKVGRPGDQENLKGMCPVYMSPELGTIFLAARPPAAAGSCERYGGRHAKSKSMEPERVAGRAQSARTRCAPPARAARAATPAACCLVRSPAQTDFLSLRRSAYFASASRESRPRGPLSRRRPSRTPTIHDIWVEEVRFVVSHFRPCALPPLRFRVVAQTDPCARCDEKTEWRSGLAQNPGDLVGGNPRDLGDLG